MDNDEKAMNLNYMSKIDFLGKERKLLRTTMRTKNQLKNLYDDTTLLMRLSGESFEKSYQEWLCTAKEMLPQIVSPLSQKEIESLDEEDIGEIWRAVDYRDAKRQHKSDKEIQRTVELQEEQRIAQMEAEITIQKKIAEGDVDFLDKVEKLMNRTITPEVLEADTSSTSD